MNEQHNVGVVKDAYAAFGRGDIDAVIASLDPEVAWTVNGPRQIRLMVPRHGRDGVAGFFKDLAEDQEVLAFEPREFVAQDDRVVALGHYSWRVRATGRIAESDWVHVFTLRDGKVRRFDEFTDSSKFAEAYGLAAAPA